MSITITRYNQSVSLDLDFEVFIDGAHIVNIQNGEAITIDVPSGMHEIHLEVDDYKTKKVEFEISDFSELNFICGSKMPEKAGIRSPFSIRRMSHFAYIELDKDMFDKD